MNYTRRALTVFTILIILLYTVGTAVALAADDAILVSKVVRVYDGDTFFANVEAWPNLLGDTIGVRIRGIDTPEIRTKCTTEKKVGYQAKALVDTLLMKADRVVIENLGRGKYFRVVADVWADEVNVADTLLKSGLALPYDGGTKVDWCEHSKGLFNK